MRVALISNSLPPEPATGGAQHYVANLAQHLGERHEVLVLSGAENCRLEGVSCVHLPALRVLRPTEALPAKAFWHLRDQWLPSVHRATRIHLRDFAPDVVGTHEPQSLSASVFTAVASLDLPHVHTTHDLNLLCARLTMTRNGEFCGGRCSSCSLQRIVRGRLVARHLHWLIAPSDDYRRRHVEAGIVPASRAVTIRHGAQPGTARIRSRRDGALRIGFIGALSPHKGILTLLAAFRRGPADWTLTVAGDGPLEERIREEAVREARINHVGYVSGEAKDAFFDGLDVLVIPSEWEEAATLVAAEAAVRGLPSVVSDRGGLPETPEARIFPAHDANGLLAAIRWFADSPDRLREASTRLLDQQACFLWSRHVAEVEDVLGMAVRQRGSATVSLRDGS